MSNNSMGVMLLASIMVVTTSQTASAFLGPSPFESATAMYFPSTGEIKVSTNTVWNWFISSPGNFTGEPAQGLTQQLITDNDDTVGEGSFIAAFTYTNLNLGSVAETGLSSNDFVFKYVIGGFTNGSEIEADVWVPNPWDCPEPATLSLAGLGLCGALATRLRVP